MRTDVLVARTLILIAFAVAACSSAAPGAPQARITPTPPPWPDGWLSSICVARDNVEDLVGHFREATRALQAFDLPAADKELEAAAKDAREVTDYAMAVDPWPAGEPLRASLQTAGEEFRKVAGLYRLALDGRVKASEAIGQLEPATKAKSAADSAYADLKASTGFDC